MTVLSHGAVPECHEVICRRHPLGPLGNGVARRPATSASAHAKRLPLLLLSGATEITGRCGEADLSLSPAGLLVTFGEIPEAAVRHEGFRPRVYAIEESALAAFSVFFISIATVISPTPPGTGVIAFATLLTGSKSTSPTSR